MSQDKQYSIGIVGVRGYVGQELLKLIHNHPNLNLDWVSSRQLKGQAIGSIFQKTDLTNRCHCEEARRGNLHQLCIQPEQASTSSG
ncbi:MAG: hypothetical protein JKX81_18855, partial [Arenicella sp.]|nr:hypothetical protein [Arenicella sp.]